MRIPVFTSRAQRPSDAPGRPITARMRAEPFIQAELRKGEVMTEALGQSAGIRADAAQGCR
jgi:hypothetical protein